jgi:hypothetical protein
MSNLEIAKQIAEKLALTSGVFGLRKTYDLNIGDDVPNSFDWDYENDCSSDVELGGASVIGLPDVYDADEIDDVLAIVEYMDQYPGNRLVLVSGDHAGLGADIHELLIANGTVVMAWDK